MRISLKYLFISILILFFIPKNLRSQELKSTESEGIKMLRVAKEIIDSSKYCALISLDKDGAPRVRPMDAFKPDNQFIIRFGTNSNSRKVEQIKNDPRVNIYYLSNEGSSYVTVHGIAKFINDEDAKEKWWKPEWEAFYPDKKTGYLIIEVKPIWIELISETNGIYGDKISWKPPIISFEQK